MAQILTDSSPLISSLSMTISVLPRYIVLKSEYNNSYLRFINEEDKQIHGFLKFSGEEAVSPYSKLEVEPAKSGKGLVHLRCCYNNKYWGRWSPDHYWILAANEEPEEDQSKWSCTLFEPVYIDDKTIRLRHVQLGHYVCLWRTDPPFDLCAYAASATTSKDKCDLLSIIDWESLVILPKHVAFKGDNGKYVSTIMSGLFPALQFGADDIGDPTVGNEITTTRDGSVRIKSNDMGKFWKRNPMLSVEYIWPLSDDLTSNDPDTVFWPIKVSNNIIALRNLGNNKFCRRSINTMMVDVPTISKEAHLEVEELVVSRNIYNAEFRLMDARIYNQQVLTMATGQATNESTETSTIDVRLKYEDSKSSTWDASVSLKLGITASVEFGIPLIADGKIEVSAEFTGAYTWGKTQESSTEMETTYHAVVPPMTKVKVSLLATKGSCDVPFSYYQRDTLTNGQQFTHQMDDGIYSGINSFNFTYVTKEEPL